MTSAGTRRSCRRTRPPRRRTRRPRPGAPSPATPSPVSVAGRSAPTNAPGSRPAAVEDVDEPARGRALAVRPGDRRSAGDPRRRRRPPAARARAGCPRSRAAASSALPGSIAVSALVTASRAGGVPAPADVRRVVRRRDVDAGGVERRGVRPGPPGSQPSTVAPAHAASSAAADAPAPAAPTTWIRSPGTDRPGGSRRREPGADVRRPANAHRPVLAAGAAPADPAASAGPTCSSSISSAARAESRLFSVRSPGHRNRRTTGSPAPATAT